VRVRPYGSRLGHATIPTTIGSIGNAKIPLPAPTPRYPSPSAAEIRSGGGAPGFWAAPRTMRKH